MSAIAMHDARSGRPVATGASGHRLLAGLRRRIEVGRGGLPSAGLLLEVLAELHGDKPLVTEDGEGGLRLSYRQAADLVARASGSIRRRIAPGDRVVVGTENGYGLFLLTLAVCRAGGVAVPVNPKSRADEIDHVISDSGAVLILRSFNDEIRADPVASAPTTPDQLAALFYTSGTTGKPKGAQLSHRSLVGQAARSTLVPPGLLRGEVVSGMPVAHIAGFSMLSMLASFGLPIYLLRRFRPDTALDAIESRRAVMFIGVPAMYRMMLEAGAEQRDLSSVWVWASGADAMPFDVASRFQDMGRAVRVPGTGRTFRTAAFVEGYGMVELGGGVAIKVLPPGLGHRLSGIVGWPMPGYRMRVVDDQGRDVPRGGVGELVVKGPGVMKGYHGRESNSETFTPDGWLRTGDLARSKRLGLVEFAGRKKDVIKHGGYSVFAVEVETALDEHPAVAESAVVGLPDDAKGEVPAAVVRTVAGKTVSEQELVDWAQHKLADYKVPRHILHADELPRSGTDKVQKDELRKWFALRGDG
ncbi:MAG TPA: AMP-binding protein [Acidimicrobiales bacterium]|nr:AMP-binding protein [Acidimicrobiales bacterium]